MIKEEEFLRRAIEIAGTGIPDGGGPFGAVIVRDGKILSEANNRVVLLHDPTAHAEILAIRDACKVIGSHDLSGCVMFASCEPCPMCLGAIYWAGIKRIIYAQNRLDAETAGFNDNLIYNEIKLSPSERRIEFVHLPVSGSESVFRIWHEKEDKITY